MSSRLRPLPRVYALTHFHQGSVAGGTLYRIDPSTNSVSATLLEGEIPPVAGISGPPVLTVGHGYVWTIRLVEEGPDEELVRIDPGSNQVEGLGILGNFHPFTRAKQIKQKVRTSHAKSSQRTGANRTLRPA